MTNNSLTYYFSGLIVAVFVLFFFQLIKLIFLYMSIAKANKSENILESTGKTPLKWILAKYENSINIQVGNVKKTNVPASEFFSEFSACKAHNVNLRMLDAASGTLVGLGLLGTFLGLTLGIEGFDSSNTENIQNSINNLLSGMGTAFYTSLFGMTLSIIFTFIDKVFRNKLSKQLFMLNERLDEMYYIDDNNVNALNQERIANLLFNNLKHEMEKQTSSMIVKTEEAAHNLQEKIVYTNNEGQVTTIGNAIREILSENTEQTKALKSFSTDLAIELNNGFDESLSRQMQQKILPLMENVDTTTKAIVEHIDKMAEQVSSPATDLIQNVVSELKGCMSNIMETMSGTATAGLESLSTQLSTAAQAIMEFPQNLSTVSATLESTIEEVKNAVNDISSTSASANNTTMKQMQDQITYATTAISNAISEVHEVMNGLSNTSQEQSRIMVDKLAEAAEKMSQYLDNTMTSLSSSVAESVKGISEDISRKQENLLVLQSEMMTKMENTMNGITQSSQEQNGRMVNNLSEASERMGMFLNETVSTISAKMRQSMQDMATDVSSKQMELLTLQETTTAQTRVLLETFNKGLERLEKLNTHIAGTMNEFQVAQGQIVGSTAHLQTVSNDMKQATTQFGKSQTEYSSMIEEMQRCNQGSIENLYKLLNDTGEMTEGYVEKFDIIKEGIGGIFQQLQNGLSEYSRTVQASTQKYLDQYTASLTNTTDSLSSAIRELDDAVEMLVDTFNSRKH